MELHQNRLIRFLKHTLFVFFLISTLVVISPVNASPREVTQTLNKNNPLQLSYYVYYNSWGPRYRPYYARPYYRPFYSPYTYHYRYYRRW